MADNTVLNLGAGGDTFAADDIGGGVKVQRVKPGFGPDGSFTDVNDADGSRLPVKEAKAATATRTNVPDNLSNVMILASNANRKSAIITNDSSGILHLALGTVAATTADYTVKLFQNQSYQVPSVYTGQINGIWATDPNDGGARVTEMV